MIVSAANFAMHINYGKCPLISSYVLDLSHVMYGVPDLPLSGSTRDESTEVEHTMHNVFNKTICVCYDINSSSGLLFIMCGYCYYIDPAAVRTCMQTNFTVHGQPPQFPRASAAND